MDLGIIISSVVSWLLDVWDITPIIVGGVSISFQSFFIGCFLLGLVLHFFNVLSGGFMTIISYAHLK